MPGIKYSPYIPNVDAWVDYFKNQPKGHKRFYSIGGSKQRGEEMDPIKLVSPTEQSVQQAKSRMKREQEEDKLVQSAPAKRRKTNSQTLKKKKKTLNKGGRFK